MTAELTPSAPLLSPLMSRDLYPLATQVRVEARQRGLTCGIVYFRLEEPVLGNMPYFQNLTGVAEPGSAQAAQAARSASRHRRADTSSADRIDFRVAADGRVVLSWK